MVVTGSKFLTSPVPGEEVVITGMAGRFPESDNVDHFFQNIFNKTQTITDDDRRWKHTNPEIPHRIGKINHIEKMDAGAFGLCYPQVQQMCPLIRMQLERCYEAVLDAGYSTNEMRDTRTGVYVGEGFSETENVLIHQELKSPNFGVLGSTWSCTAQRISAMMGLKGPSYNIDTACSSGLNALEEAYKDIRRGTCDNAFVAGLSLCLSSVASLQFSRLGVLSHDGVCKVFDEKADGYVRSEAVSVIFLQKAKNARRIYAQVVHAKASCDGFKEEGMIFPSGKMQEQLMREVYDECGIDATTIDFFEAHGTGTFVGDTAEMTAADEVFCKNRKEPLLVGSVKSHIGHTECASGLCSIVKVLLQMEANVILPNVNYDTPKSSIKGLCEGRMIVPVEVTPWPKNGSGLVGLNGAGFGGSNVHVILKRWNKAKVNGGMPLDDLPRLVCVSGRTEEAVWNILNTVNDKNLDVEFIRLLQEAFKDAVTEHYYRGYIVQSKEGMVTKSVSFFDGVKKHLCVLLTSDHEKYLVLGKELMQLRVFEETLQKIDSVLDLKIFCMVKEGSCLTFRDTIICTVAIQMGLVDLFKAVIPCFDCVVGISIGKIAADYANGKTSLKEAMLSATNESLKPLLTSVDGASKQLHRIDDSTKTGGFFLPSEATTLNSFLALLGNIYTQGHQINCECLYSDVQWPVSAGTSTISPIIGWNYTEDWHVYNDELILNKFSCQITLVNKEIDWSLLTGHNIDGLVLMPASGYIQIAMYQYCKFFKLNMLETTFVFEQIRFHQAVHVPKELQKVKFQLYFESCRKRFEITNQGQTIVSGYIYVHNHVDHQLPNPLLSSKSSKTIHLELQDIYKELYLRGYKYNGSFCEVHHADLDENVSWVKWENSWTSFLDNLLQTALLKLDTRNLYVPVTIGEIVIDNSLHLGLVKALEKDALIPVHFSVEANVVSCGSVQIRGLQPSAIPRRKIRNEPVLERQVFVPFTTNFTFEEAMRVCIGIVLENNNGYNVKTVEVVDCNEQKVLSSEIVSVFKDIPLIKSEVTVLTDTELEIPSVKIKDGILKDEPQCSLIILRDACQHTQINDAVSVLKAPGFIISCQSSTWNHNINNLEHIATITTGFETLVLLKKIVEDSSEKVYKVSLNGKTFDWIPDLQAIMKGSQKILLVVENEFDSGVLGLFNCLRREHGGNLLRYLFIMDLDVRFDQDDEFFTNQLKKSLRVNVLKNGLWGTYRHLPLQQPQLVESENAYCRLTQVGDMSSLRWFKSASAEPVDRIGSSIDICYSAINFKDLALCLGIVAPDAFTRSRLEQIQCYNQGLEFSGTDSRGRRVMGFSVMGGSLSNKLTEECVSVYDIPDNWSMVEAATVPVCYGTVIFALTSVRIKEGDSILIHAGSGGIGQAALHIATWYKCNIFTTVSSQEKRQFVRAQFPHVPDTHIGNSRDTSFVEMVFRETRGRGVDIVLNSLTGDKLKASVGCLASRGRFAEIGKHDLLKNREMELAVFSKGCSFCSIMMDLIFMAGPIMMKNWYDIFNVYLKKSAVKPLHYTVFNHDEVEQAYRFMASGKHVGKLLLRVKDQDKPPTVFNCYLRFHCSPHSTCIIVGGLGGVGLELADWLVLRGARKLVLVSRTGVQTGYASYRIRAWRSYEVKVKVSTDDVTTHAGCVALLQKATKLGDVEAIFNLGLVLTDELFENQTEENFLITLGPKATATRFLDAASRDLCPNLRYFVVFSSVVSGHGNIGQTTYGMANSIMERICEKRKADGYPALAIQWGPIGYVGVAAHINAEISGTIHQRIESCLNVLDRLLGQNETIVSSIVVAEKRNSLNNATGVIDLIKNILGISDLKTVSEHATLPGVGMDSISGLEIKLTLERECDIYLNPNDVRTLTFAKLKEMIDNNVNTNTVENAKPSFDLFYNYVGKEEDVNVPIMKLKSSVETDASAPCVFLLPGIEGTSLGLEPLAEYLEAHIQCFQYLYNTPEDDTVTVLAERAFLDIPSDSYFKVVGYSYGCLVAIELVSRLEARGQKGSLILIDGSHDACKYYLTQQLGLDSVPALDTATLIKLVKISLGEKEAFKHQMTIFKFGSRNERVEYVLGLIGKNKKFSNEYYRQVCMKACSRIHSIVAYMPDFPKLQSSVTLFVPSDPSVLNFDKDYALGKWCENPVRVEVIEGNHLTIIKNPDLANRINCILKEENA